MRFWLCCASALALFAGACSSDYAAQCGDLDCGAGRCVVDDGGPLCLCNEGALLSGPRCVLPGVCVPNPCTTAHRTACREAEGRPVCDCDPGHHVSGATCVANVNDTCGPHPEAGGDTLEPSDCPLQATVLALDTATNAGFFPAGDVDWFAVEATAGHAYELTTSGAGLSFDLDAYLSDGETAIAADHRGAEAGLLAFRAPQAGRYYVRVKALSAAATGSYAITLRDRGPDDHGDVPGDATTVAPGATLGGSLSFDGDRDVFVVSISGGRSYVVDVTLASAAASTLIVDLLSGDRSTVLATREGTTVRVPLFASLSTKRYLRVSSPRGAAGEYSLALTDLGSDDYGDGPGAAGALSLGYTETGTFERGDDVDALAFPAVAGHAYVMKGQTGTLARLALLDEAGRVLAQGERYDPVSAFAPADGILYALVSTNGPSSVNGTWSLTVTDAGPDDHGDTTATADAITVDGGAVNGAIQTSSDVDLFVFPATKGHVYTAHTGNTAAAVRILDAHGAPQGQRYPGDGEAWAVAAEDGILSVEVRKSYASTFPSYGLMVRDEGVDEVGDTVATGRPLAVPTLQTGAKLQYPDDKDVFSFHANAGQVLVFGFTTQLLLRLRVLDAAGHLLADLASHNLNGRLAYEFPADGTYAIEVRDDGSSLAGTYTYSLTDAGVDDVGDTSDAALAVTPGEAPASARLDAYGDVDVFSFPTVAGHNYRVNVVPQDPSGPASLSVRVFDGAGARLASSSLSTMPAFLASTTQTCFATVRNDSSVDRSPLPYTVQVEDFGPDDHGNTPATASALDYDDTTPGRIETPQDVDTFVITPNAGRVLRITVTPDGALREVDVGLVSAGTALVRTASGGVLGWKAPATPGPVYVTVKGRLADATGTYTLLATDGADDCGDDAASACALTVGVASSGVFEALNDRDVFAFTAQAGKTYATSVSINASPFPAVTSPTGGPVSMTGSFSSAFVATVSGTYAVHLTPGFGSVVPGATYTVTVVER